MKNLKERRLKALKETYENYFIPLCKEKNIELISFEEYLKKANKLRITLA